MAERRFHEPETNLLLCQGRGLTGDIPQNSTTPQVGEQQNKSCSWPSCPSLWQVAQDICSHPGCSVYGGTSI